ncbi:unnamed protein product [Adineta ricciae]|uniref:Uncharacterized protein n=1 Tax=Adineta ricciae TaxID=249248 RepID=A0A815GHG2_ADIRI|nr:unnamed protein product [Adineta ricciae]CAF1338502.1 unnamed protein product [Adineta ricciae]
MTKFIDLFILIIQIFNVHGYFSFDATAAARYYTLDGQVLYLHGPQTLIEPNSELIVELHDISVKDVFSVKVAEQTRAAVVFPIIFNISYNPERIILHHVHIINVRIVNMYDEIMFVNQKRIEVSLLGHGRTTFIDVPVIRVIYKDIVGGYYRVREWPKLVGMDGEKAVNIIKNETGLAEVFVVTDRSKVSKDIRYDRVCIYVNEKGKVARIPTTG